MKRMMTGLALLAFGLASGLASAQAGEVHVLNWKGYGTDEPWAVEAFEKKTGHTVVHDYFNYRSMTLAPGWSLCAKA